MKNKYNAGDVIDLRFTRDSMPDRIYIGMVYKKDSSTEWMYQVFSEKKNGTTFIAESQIDKLISRKESKCYENPIVSGLYENGFRWCGNSKENTAFNKANSMVNAKYIKHILLAEAFDKDNNPMPGYLGLWVQYNATIDDKPVKNKNGYYFVK